MRFNSCDFERIRYTFSNGPVINYAYLASDGLEIFEKEHLSDLGIAMSNNAAFQDHTKQDSYAHSMERHW